MTISEIVENLLDAAIRARMWKAAEQGQQIYSLFFGSITLSIGLCIIPPMNGFNWNTRLMANRWDGYHDITGIA